MAFDIGVAKNEGSRRVNQISFALLIAVVLGLTVYFAVGAWNASAEDDFGPPTALLRTSVHEATRQQFRFFCDCEAFTSYRRASAYPIGRSAEIIAAVALGGDGSRTAFSGRSRNCPSAQHRIRGADLLRITALGRAGDLGTR